MCSAALSRQPADLTAHCLGSCSIYEKIGKGKHSVVYKGRKKKTIQYYAVKSVDKSQKARVLQEASTPAPAGCHCCCSTPQQR
jgi:hypothetical protein